MPDRSRVLILFVLIVIVGTMGLIAQDSPWGITVLNSQQGAIQKARITSERADFMMYPNVRSEEAFVQQILGEGFKVKYSEEKEGRLTLRCQQLYKGIPVLGSEVTVNADTAQQQILSVKGFNFDVAVALNVTPSVEQKVAVAAAKSYFPQTNLEYKNPQLAILCSDVQSHLVWSFLLYNEYLCWQFMVDAHDGKTVHCAYSLLPIFDKATTGQTQLINDGVAGGTNFQFSCKEEYGKYSLQTAVNDTQVMTFHMQKLDDNFNTDPQAGEEDTSNSNTKWEDPVTATAHFYTENVAHFYQEVFGRKSIDNNNFPLRSRIHLYYKSWWGEVDKYYNNAFWHPGYGLTSYGDGNWLKPKENMSANERRLFSYLCVADVICHEWTHGFTSYSSNLEYRAESGAMNEAMSDIIGCTFEYWLSQKYPNREWDWTRVGEECTPTGSELGRDALRYMYDPTLAKQPKEYKGEYWHDTNSSNDNGGVHTNCTVGNHAFYLMASGGSNNNVDVQGIGVILAAKIFYYTNARHLSSYSQYADWPQACLDACNEDITAEDIKNYGTPGITKEQIRAAINNAWRAVKVLK